MSDESPEEIYPKAGIYAEFGKIICISVGYLTQFDQNISLRIKSFAGQDEKALLSDFCELLTQNFNTNNHFLCAHNGKEFDFPYLCRRILINKLQMPSILDMMGKKPWEVRHFDTMQMWKFGDFKNYTSLDLLSEVFGIPSPKNDIDGSMIHEVYYKDNDLERIMKYCTNDVKSLVNIFLRMNGQDTIDQDFNY